MLFSKKINPKAKPEINTGFGQNSADYGGRFVNKSGYANVKKRGLALLERISWYHTMLALPRWKFIGIIFLTFLLINLVFATLYYFIGVENLGGIIYSTPLKNFAESFFFSCQTFTTVGYGRINPVGFIASAIAAFESLVGVMSFALATGLLFGRFAKPTAYLRFSENALIAPYKDFTGFMFRVAPYKNNSLTDAEAKLTLAVSIEENGHKVNRFYNLSLELEKVNTLTMSWTLVHPITPESPLFKLTPEDFKSSHGEFLVYIKAFDDMFSNIVLARTSYIFPEVVHGAKFVPMFHRSGNHTILELDKLNDFVPAILPVPSDSSIITG